MKFNDRVYGEIQIFESMILDLLKTKTFRRLRGVDQAGYSKVFYPGAEQSRFEHSIGVFYLLRRFGRPLEELMAGLIHDVSHSAFSHSVDYVFGKTEKDQSHQDSVFRDFIQQSEIPRILKKHSFPIDSVIELDRYPLLDRNIPELSADRIDYSLRSAVAESWITSGEAMTFIAGLSTYNEHFVFNDFELAMRYARLFLKLNREIYSGPTSALMFRTVGDCVGYALNAGYISEADLYQTDKHVLSKVRHHLSSDRKLAKLWNRMNLKTKWKFTKTGFNAHVFCKSRIVDPLFVSGNKTYKVSQKYQAWNDIVRAELKPKEYFIRFFDS